MSPSCLFLLGATGPSCIVSDAFSRRGLASICLFVCLYIQHTACACLACCFSVRAVSKHRELACLLARSRIVTHRLETNTPPTFFVVVCASGLSRRPSSRALRLSGCFAGVGVVLSLSVSVRWFVLSRFPILSPAFNMRLHISLSGKRTSLIPVRLESDSLDCQALSLRAGIW